MPEAARTRSMQPTASKDVIDLRHGQGRRPRRPDRRGRRRLQHRRRHRLSTATYCADARGDDARRAAARQGAGAAGAPHLHVPRPRAGARGRAHLRVPRRRAREIAGDARRARGRARPRRLSRRASGSSRRSTAACTRALIAVPVPAARSRSQVRGPADADDRRRRDAAGDPQPGARCRHRSPRCSARRRSPTRELVAR